MWRSNEWRPWGVEWSSWCYFAKWLSNKRCQNMLRLWSRSCIGHETPVSVRILPIKKKQKSIAMKTALNIHTMLNEWDDGQKTLHALKEIRRCIYVVFDHLSVVRLLTYHRKLVVFCQLGVYDLLGYFCWELNEICAKYKQVFSLYKQKLTEFMNIIWIYKHNGLLSYISSWQW